MEFHQYYKGKGDQLPDERLTLNNLASGHHEGESDWVFRRTVYNANAEHILTDGGEYNPNFTTLMRHCLFEYQLQRMLDQDAEPGKTWDWDIY